MNTNSICKSSQRKPINDLPFLGKIRMPLFVWLTDWIALLFAGAVSVIWPIVIFEPPRSHPVWAGAVIWLIPLAALVAVIKDHIRQVKTAKLEIQVEGIQKPTKAGNVNMKWEDITRYEPSGKLGFTLFFKNADRIEIPGCVEHFNDIKNYCLQKLEHIGNFEDGRKVPRTVFSISFKRLFLLLAIIVALVVVVIELIK